MNERLFYVTAHFPYGRGESFIGPEIIDLKKRGIYLTVLPTYLKGEKYYSIEGIKSLKIPLFKFSFFIQFIWCLFKRPKAVFRTFRYIATQPSKFYKNIPVVFKACFLVRSMSIRKEDHIHAHWGSTSSTMALAMAILSGCRWSFTCHRWDIYENNLLALKSSNAEFVRFISKKGLVDGLERGVQEGKAIWLPMGVKMPEGYSIRLYPQSNIVKLACIANLVEVKGHIYLIEAIKHLKQKKIRCKLSVYGDGPLLQGLKKLARDLNVDECITFYGHTQHEIIHSELKSNIDIVVLPSINTADGQHEGVPVCLMEAMSYGIPVISTKTGSIEELLEPKLGLTVPEKDSLALAEKLEELIVDSERYESASLLVSQLITENWNVEKVTEQLDKKFFKRD